VPIGRVCVGMVAIAVSGAGCARPFDVDAVVNCATLTPIPDDMIGDFSSDALLAGLQSGDGQVTVVWTSDNGSQAYVSRPDRAVALTNLDGGWAVQAMLNCLPAATTSAHLAMPADGPRPLRQGSYEFSALGFDVPDLEQGTDHSQTVLEGDIVIDTVRDRLVTGRLLGHGHMELVSFFGQRPLGISVDLVAFAFKDVRLVDDYSSP
jgi:hypothetical protein